MSKKHVSIEELARITNNEFRTMESKMEKGFTELAEAITKLTKGVDELRKGTDELRKGVDENFRHVNAPTLFSNNLTFSWRSLISSRMVGTSETPYSI